MLQAKSSPRVLADGSKVFAFCTKGSMVTIAACNCLVLVCTVPGRKLSDRAASGLPYKKPVTIGSRVFDPQAGASRHFGMLNLAVYDAEMTMLENSFWSPWPTSRSVTLMKEVPYVHFVLAAVMAKYCSNSSLLITSQTTLTWQFSQSVNIHAFVCGCNHPNCCH